MKDGGKTSDFSASSNGLSAERTWRATVTVNAIEKRASLWFGIAAAIHYHVLGLTLAHYDARAHLVVARRVFDSLTPGWIQLGAVWLPLPQILNALPAQVDVLYRTGASASLISLAAFVLGLWALAEAGFAQDLVVCAKVDSHPVIPILQDRQITKLGPDRER